MQESIQCCSLQGSTFNLENISVIFNCVENSKMCKRINSFYYSNLTITQKVPVRVKSFFVICAIPDFQHR